MELTDKAALVTGGASGIGLSIVEELLIHKIKGVVIADINAETGDTVTKELTEKYGPRVVFQKTNVINQLECEDAFKKAINKFGQLDIVVNNAGIANESNYEKEININMMGVMHGVALAMKYMSKDKGGKGGIVLSTSSICAVDVVHAIPIYASTKAAVMTLMRGFGHPFHYDITGIRMMALLPGITYPTALKLESAFNPTRTDETETIIIPRPKQKPLAVARAAMHLIKNGESASSWVIEGNQLYLLQHPKWETYATLISKDLDK